MKYQIECIRMKGHRHYQADEQQTNDREDKRNISQKKRFSVCYKHILLGEALKCVVHE